MKNPLPKQSPAQIVQALRQQLQASAGVMAPGERKKVPISSGCAALDRWLPAGGWLRGTLVEWLSAARGGGAGTLALIAARQICAEGGHLVVMSRARHAAPVSSRLTFTPHRTRHESEFVFYPPAAAAWGIDLERLIVIRAGNEKDELWALDQTLRCRAVAAVWAPLVQLDERYFRRLQLAAESSGAIGLLLRPAHIRGRPTWSEMQLLVRPRPRELVTRNPPGHETEGGRRLQVQLVRCRGATAGSVLELEIDERTGALREAGIVQQAKVSSHETHTVHLAARLAHPTPRRRATRA